jgi:hypothetical protein
VQLLAAPHRLRCQGAAHAVPVATRGGEMSPTPARANGRRRDEIWYPRPRSLLMRQNAAMTMMVTPADGSRLELTC